MTQEEITPKGKSRTPRKRPSTPSPKTGRGAVDKPANKKLLFHMTITAITGRLNKNNIIINFAVRRPNLKAQCLASERIFTFNFLNSLHSAYRLLVTKVDETFSFRIKKFIISRNN